jgi:hypothetical protein
LAQDRQNKQWPPETREQNTDAQWGEWPVSLDKTRETKVKISMFFVHSLIDKTLLHLYQKNLGQNIVYLLP